MNPTPAPVVVQQAPTRHPSTNFIKFLMTAPTMANDDASVSFSVVQLGYPPPDPEFLKNTRLELEAHQPVFFQPQNRYHRDSQKYLKSQNIWSLHHPDKATIEANGIVTNLRARPLIENLLLGRMDPKDVAKRVNARLGEFFTNDGIEAYGHYYWNVGLLRVEDWEKLLKDYDYQRHNTMSILEVGPSMALHKLGFQQSLESKTILREMMEGVYFDFREWKAQPRSESKTRSIVSLAKAATILDMQISQADGALRESLRAFEAFRMKTNEQKPKGIRDLAPQGEFSGSGAKLLDSPIPLEVEENAIDAVGVEKDKK